MRGVRRAVAAVVGAIVFAALIRLRGRGGVPVRRGGWQEVTTAELHDSYAGS